MVLTSRKGILTFLARVAKPDWYSQRGEARAQPQRVTGGKSSRPAHSSQPGKVNFAWGVRLERGAFGGQAKISLKKMFTRNNTVKPLGVTSHEMLTRPFRMR